MPWVQVVIVVVDDDLDNVVVFDDVRVDLAVYKRVRGVVAAHGQSTVKCWNVLTDIGTVVDIESECKS